jgi:hypothetical protein
MKRFTTTEIFAVLISIASVAISVNGNRTQERLLSASVWPYLSFGTGNTSDDGQSKVINLSITNSGNGPARIKDFSVEYDKQKLTSAYVLMDRCCALKATLAMTSPVIGKVLRPGEELNVFKLPFSVDIADGWKLLDRKRFEVILSACYCSTLDECWNVRSDQPDPAPVPVCRAKSSQWHG